MNNYRYTLDKSSKKFLCPQCNKKRFVRYIDNETKEYLPNEFGTCDRLVNCGYDNNPYKARYHKSELAKNGKNWQSNLLMNVKVENAKTCKNLRKTTETYGNLHLCEPIPENVLLHTLKDYDNNNFIQYLCSRYGADTITKQIEAYFVGTVGQYTSFAYIDKKGVCRAISLIEYDKQGKRRKNDVKQARNIHTFLQAEYKRRNQTLPNWLQNYLQNERKFSCLFGEHLINLPSNLNKPIAVVEAPKTAFIASIVYDTYTWVAAGALNYLTMDRLRAIQGREVYLFPDTSLDSIAFNLWNDKAKQYGFSCIDILEYITTNEEKIEGYDLADYLLKYEFAHKDLRIQAINSGNLQDCVLMKKEDQGAVRSNFRSGPEILNVVNGPTIELFENENPTSNIGNYSELTTNEGEVNRSIMNYNKMAYVDTNGILYIPTPPLHKIFTRYSKGVAAYNNRTQIPDFIEILPTGTKKVLINPKTLTILTPIE